MQTSQPLKVIERKASLFRNGRSQAVRIPKEFEMPGREVIIEKSGDVLVLKPVKTKQTLLDLLSSWEPMDVDWPEIDDPLPRPVNL